MTFDVLVGQQSAKNRLVRTLRDGRSHAFLITGPDGSGKSTLARAFAQHAVCDAPTERGACGTCTPCVLFEAGTNPDVRFLERSRLEKEKYLKVERVRRELSSDVDLRPQFSRRKVYVVEADDLNEQGQNALLKTLEEPPPNVVLALVARTSASLLPTVLSRVCHVRLRPSPPEDLRRILAAAGVSDEGMTAFYSRYAQGVPGAALALAASQDFAALREGVFSLLGTLGTATRSTLLTEGYAFFADTRNKKEIDDLLTLLATVVRDLLVLSTARDPDLLMHADKKDMMERIRPKGGDAARRCQAAAAAIEAARRGLRANTSYETTVCELLLQMRKEFSHA